MSVITDLLLRRLVRDYQRVQRVEVRARYGLLEAWVSIVGNLVLFVVKFGFGVTTRSVALTADAFHTLGDMVTSVVVLFGFRVVRTPADVNHPYGHGRAEPIATLVIAILLVITGLEFMHMSFDRLREPVPIQGPLLAIGIMVGSTMFKEWMARFSLDLGQRIKSEMLKADAWHHRSDAIASVLVIAAMVGARLGYRWLDSVLGMGVALLIAGTGFHLARSMVSMLLGQGPSEELTGKIIAAAASTPGVHGVHGIQVHDYGSQQVAVVHIEVSSQMTTEQSHAVANEVEEALSRRLGLSPVVHVDLGGKPARSATMEMVTKVLPEVLAAHPQVSGFHGLLILEDEKGSWVEVHLQLPSDSPLQEAHLIGHQVSEELSKRLSGAKVNVHTEPSAHPS